MILMLLEKLNQSLVWTWVYGDVDVKLVFKIGFEGDDQKTKLSKAKGDLDIDVQGGDIDIDVDIDGKGL